MKRLTNMKRSRWGPIVATVVMVTVGCGSGQPMATEPPPSATSPLATGAAPGTTTQPEAVQAEPEVVPGTVEIDGSVFESGWTIDDEEVQLFALSIGMEPEEALQVLQFQSAASRAMGDLEDVFGDRFILSAFTPGQTELTVFVTRSDPADEEWLTVINAQPTGGRFIVVEDPELAEERAARCPSFASIAISPPELEFQVSVDGGTVITGERFTGHVTVFNPTETDIGFGGYPSFAGVLLADASYETVTWPLTQEPILRRDWVIGPGETIEIGFSGGTEPCGYGAPSQLPPGTSEVGVAWSWGLLGPATIDVVAP